MKLNARSAILWLLFVAESAAGQSNPLFQNGGFEDGTFTGWTIEYGFYQGNGIVQWGVSPHGLHQIIGVGEFQPGQTLTVNPYDGTWMARINDVFGNNHASRLSQTAVVTQQHLDDGGFVYVQWGAMLVDPQHAPSQQPFFHIEVLQNGNILDQFQANATDAANQGWTNAGNAGGTLWYRADVYSVDISMLAVGDQLTIRMAVADCSLGGHGGFAFLDGIGTTPPAQSIVLAPTAGQGTIGSTHTVTATVADTFGNPVVGTSVAFTITSGPHAGMADTDLTDLSGQARFSFQGALAGRDTIEGCFVDSGMNVLCDDVTQDWVDPADQCCHSGETRLTSPGAPTDQFGGWVDIEGDFAVVGTASTFSQELAYVYQRDEGGTPGVLFDDTWLLVARLDSASGGAVMGIAIQDPLVVVVKSARLELFVRPVSGWIDLATPTAVLSGAFGQKVGISGDVLIAGGDTGTAEAYVYVEPPGGWLSGSSPTAVLRATDAGANDGFGPYVGIDGGTIVVGAYQNPTSGPEMFRGAAYVYLEPAGGWGGVHFESAKLIPSGSPAGIAFGAGVAVDGDVILVSAVDGGPGYVFEKPVGGWSGTLTETAQLSPSVAGLTRFGESPALDGEVALLGCYQEQVFCFVRGGASWTDMTETGVIVASDGMAGDGFGRSNAHSQGVSLLGAGRANALMGAAYLQYRGDATAPMISCPQDIKVLDDKGTAGEIVLFSVSATDNCDPAPQITSTPPSGSTFPRGTTLVTCTARDTAGNQSQCTFSVVVDATVRRKKL